ncbi:MAG: Gfo/Idh/MocA family oxidoreductase [Candidatus Sumerlaeota bacterium]|nr:Gfo/Idh/MocA family oxidoreductase [Candidatus Sumerlaeota bacterium]
MRQTKSIRRRDFLKGMGAAAGAALAFPAIVPSSALGADGATAPSNRILMGAIGCGGMGNGDIDSLKGKQGVQFLAVCDVDRKHREDTKKKIDNQNKNADCQMYEDFRDMLAKGGLDAVMIAVPDHWHALAAVACAKAGLDIYGEKPLARSIREAGAIVDAVQRYGRVWQTGSWQRSVSNFRHGCELVRNGRIGKIQKVEVGLPTGGARGVAPTKPVPPELNWEMWLGPAPWRPYCEFSQGGIHFHWRWIMDYSGGQLTDWAGHHIDIAHWGLNFDNTGPNTIEGKGDYPKDGLYNVPSKYKFTCVYQNGQYPNGLEMTVANDSTIGFMGTKWYGENGAWVYVDRGRIDASNKNWLKASEIGAGDIRLYNSPDHSQNFLDCVRSRQLTITPVETACRSISVGLLGEIAMLTGRKIKWDPVKQEIIGDAGASALLCKPYRKPWVL